MEASQGNVRGVVETLTKVVEALSAAGIELLGDNTKSDGGGRGVRFKEPAILAQRRPAASLARGKKGRTIVRVKAHWRWRRRTLQVRPRKTGAYAG